MIHELQQHQPRWCLTLLTFLVVGTVAGGPGCTKKSTIPLQLELEERDGERSRDSHEQRYHIRVAVAQVTYTGPVGPCERGQCAHRTVRFTLTEAQGRQVAEHLKGCFSTFQEQGSTDGLGSYAVTRLTARLQKQAADIAVAGMVRAQGAGATTLSEEARGYRSRVGRLRRLLTGLAREHLPGAV